MREIEVRRGAALKDDYDDLDELLDEEMRDPEFRAAYEDATTRSALLRALVSRRSEHRVSQADVAARMGTTQSAVSDLERGATDPRLSTLQRYARAVGCALHLVLRAEKRRGRNAWVYTPPRIGSVREGSIAAERTFWTIWSRSLVREGGRRIHELAAPSATRIAPVELRPEPDEFTRSVVR